MKKFRKSTADKTAANLKRAVANGTLTQAQADKKHAMVLRAVAAAQADRVVRR